MMAWYVVVAFAAWFVAHAITRQYILAFLWRARNLRTRTAPGFWILYPLSILGLSGATTRLAHQPVRYVPMYIGVMITLFGFALMKSAEWHLGKNWSNGIGLHEKHELVTTGPYRLVRHPMYSGMYLSMLGLGIFSWNIFFLGSALCAASAYGIGAIGEDSQLRQRFGRKHEGYMKQTGMFIPRIRKERG